MPKFVKNKSLRLIHIDGLMVVPGTTSTDPITDERAESEGVKMMVKANEIELTNAPDDGGENEPAQKPTQKPAAAAKDGPPSKG